MALLTLTVQNPSSLPEGVPSSFRMTGRRMTVGRDAGADWTLPDPSRTVSGLHFEVRAEGNGFWLHDHSTNGVFVNGATERVKAPCRLSHGDRLLVGRYLIAVAIGAAEGVGAPSPAYRGGAAGGERPGAGQGRPAYGHPRPAVATGPPVAMRTIDRGDDLLEAFCRAAGMTPDVLAARDRRELAEELGQFVRITIEQLGLLLKSRAAAKAMTRSASRTVLGTSDNNPLKFVPDPAEAAEAMFGRRRTGYLDARGSIEEAFADLRRHELASYAAMQKALARLLEPLSPDVIEAKADVSMFGSRKSRAWDIYVERWEERSRSENGLLDAFFAYFAEAYDDEVEELDLSP